MRGNFSRTHFPETERGSLFMQQGRPLLDSDWNAQVSLINDELRRNIKCITGDAGAPADQAGFNITPVIGIALNPIGITDIAEAILLAPSPNLPFWCGEEPARPFRIQLGIRIESFGEGTIIHIPGVFTLSMNAEGYLSLCADALSPIVVISSETPVRGAKPLPLLQLVLIDITFDGMDVQVTSLSETLEEDELSLAIELQQPNASNSYALALGSSIGPVETDDENDIPDLNQEPSNPLAASFWQLVIINGCQAFSMEFPFGQCPNQEMTGLACAINFDTLSNGAILDISEHQNDVTIVTGDREPSLMLLDTVISDGDYLSHGILYKNLATVLSSNQPNLAAITFSRAAIDTSQTPYFRFYLDTWKRLVTDLGAPANHDPALGNIDTTADLRNIWQVKHIAAETADCLQAKWQKLNACPEGSIKLNRLDVDYPIPNGLLRIEIHHSGWSHNWPICETALDQAIPASLSTHDIQVASLQLDQNTAVLALLDRPVLAFAGCKNADGELIASKDDTPVFTSVIGIQHEQGEINLTLAHAPPQPTANQSLYLLPIASFKYSPRNGSLSYPVQKLDWAEDGTLSAPATSLTAQLSFPGYNGLEIKNGDWLELRNREIDLLEHAGTLFQVESFMSQTLEILLTPQLGYSNAQNTKVNLGEFPTLTLWEGNFTKDSSPIANTKWTRLYDGIEVIFSDDSYYSSGQYWTAPTREALPCGIIWPGIAEQKPEFQSPQGPIHRYTPLADISLSTDCITVQDQRNIFRSLINEPFADLDDRTAAVLFETARLMELLGLLDMKITARDLPKIIRTLIRHLLEEIYQNKVRFLGVSPDAPEGLFSTKQKIIVAAQPDFNWYTEEPIPDLMAGAGFSATLAGRHIFVNEQKNTVWAFNASQRSWTELCKIPEERRHYSIISDNHKIYVVGGWIKCTFSERYAARKILTLNSVGEWETIGSIGHFTEFPSVGIVGDQLLVSGGFGRDGNALATMGYIDLNKGKWRSLDCAMENPTGHAATLVHGGLWYIFGGASKRNTESLGQFQSYSGVFDPVRCQWQDLAPMPTELAGQQITILNKSILILGGQISDSCFSNTCFQYSLEADQWFSAQPLETSRGFFGLMQLEVNDLRILSAFGGKDGSEAALLKTDFSMLDEALYLYE